MYGRVDTAANGAAEGPLLAHASREDSGVISAKERTVANGTTVSGVGIGESHFAGPSTNFSKPFAFLAISW